MKQTTATIHLTLTGPILTQSSVPGALGIDTPVARNEKGLPYLPFSLIKGRIRQSWEELGYNDSSAWFGDRPRSGDYLPARGRLTFSDFVLAGNPPATQIRHRIAISSETGAADDGALQIIESPFAPGEAVSFRGQVSWLSEMAVRAEPPLEAVTARNALEHAFRWTTSFGAGRSVGFGRVAAVELEVTEQECLTAPPAGEVPARIGLTIRMLDPFCVSKRRVSDNIFESDTILTGGVLRGYLAATINQAIGRPDGKDVTDFSEAPTLWPALRSAFNDLRITHAFPARATDSRPSVAPLSLVKTNGQIYDVALCVGPTLIDGQAPAFRVDWKSSADVDADFGWPSLQRQLRVRTAIDRGKRRAQDEQLFAYEMVVPPEDVVWRGVLDLEDVSEANRPAVVADLESLLALSRPGIGKSKARAEIMLHDSAALIPDAAAPAIEEQGPWIMSLQTPALLCDPLELGPAAGREELGSEYARVFEQISKSSLRLIRYFATQSLAGGYLTRRFQSGKQYYPFLLTDEASVFVFETGDGVASETAAETLKSWKRGGLPLPPWAIQRYTDDWSSCPFRPKDGFGEVAVGPSRYPTPNSPPIIELDPPMAAQSKNPTLGERTHPSPPETRLTADSTTLTRWRIEGNLTTLSPFHLGDGTVTHRSSLDEHEGKAGIEIAAVATAPRLAPGEGVLPYIPGSSLKGALRARLWARGVADWDIEHIFGRPATTDDSGSGGIAEFHDAIASMPSESVGENVPWWEPSRLTGVATSVSIDRHTRSAEEHKLFHREYVPPGVTFHVAIAGEGLTEDDVKVLFGALGKEGDPLVLGKESGNGWGRFSWALGTVTRLQPEKRAAWLKAGAFGFDGFVDRISYPPDMIEPSDGVVFPLSIVFDGPYLVNDPSRSEVKKKKGRAAAPDGVKELPDHTALVDGNGKPILPGSSLRGALRSQAERIVRTLGGGICAANDRCAVERVPPRSGRLQLDALCPACLLFGTTGWASLVRLFPFVLSNDPKELCQDFVAIDRFTGGAAHGAKFDAVSFWKPEFEGKIVLDAQRATDELRERALGLLALTLRDLAEGDVPIGFGSAKGYGACTARWLGAADTARIHAAIASFRKTLPSPTSSGSPATTTGSLRDLYPSGPRLSTSPAVSENDFHNPYAFVPVARRTASPKPVAKQLQEDATHAAYQTGRFSGRIRCTLECETPVAIGSAHTKNDQTKLTEVEPFAIDGRPAIPASSLRGLVSSLAEAASNSALRVLSDSTYSRRMEASEAFRSLGMVVIEDGKRYLRPLGSSRNWRKLGEYWSDSSVTPPELRLLDKSLLAVVAPSSFSADSGQVWEATEVRGKIVTLKRAGTLDAFLKSPRRGLFGIIRVLGIQGREREMPQSKRWELFIPIDSIGPKIVDVEAAAGDFEVLASERASVDPNLPFLWKGATSRTDSNKRFRLRAGDLVFYESKNGKVALSISQIWRRPIEQTTHDFFGAVSPGLLPFGAEKAKGRTSLTPAELLFGFVSQQRSANGETQGLGSRVRFGFGLPIEATFEPQLRLRKLASPKPPSPEMYFHRSGDRAISKRTLRANDQPNGRKLYVHHRPADVQQPTSLGPDGSLRWSWQSHTDEAETNLEGHSAVKPIRRGSRFTFPVRFDNLTRGELGLLLYALRPTAPFRHKLGMGKPIGLGSVRIDVDSVELDDRFARYDSVAPCSAPFEDWPSLVSEWRDAMDANIRHAIELIGNPASTVARVHYPTTPDQLEDDELELFKWFGANDELASAGSNAAQSIQPISTADSRLPILRRDPAAPSQPPASSPRSHSQSPAAAGGRPAPPRVQDHAPGSPGESSERHQEAVRPSSSPAPSSQNTTSPSRLDVMITIESGVIIATHGAQRIVVNDMTPGASKVRTALAGRHEIRAYLTTKQSTNGPAIPVRIEPQE
jgi:CRISPR/Cas system CSM-associated protein Csm3 (group 7 of RAMP superfamily)